MKKLSTYLFLVLFSFSALSFADDINELEIEGISIGESLLDYLSKDEIINEIEANKSTYNYLNNDFGEVYLYGNFEKYDYLYPVSLCRNQKTINKPSPCCWTLKRNHQYCLINVGSDDMCLFR